MKKPIGWLAYSLKRGEILSAYHGGFRGYRTEATAKRYVKGPDEVVIPVYLPDEMVVRVDA